MSSATPSPPPRLLLIAAFAALYIIWGSTYLGIKIAVETMPAFPMIGARHLIAGIVLYAVLRFAGVPAPQREHWKGGALGGIMLLVIGNGLVAFTAKKLPSGVASLVVATTPIWMVAAASFRPGGAAPVRKEWAGLALGLLGLMLLAGPSLLATIRGQAGTFDPRSAGLVLIGCTSWAIGSVLGREMSRPANAFMGSAIQMLCAGVLLTAGCIATGQWNSVHIDTFSSRSWLAFWYLIFFGSLLGFSAFVWLMRVAKTSHVATYAYVNPIVALLLGASLGNELITRGMLVAAGVTLAGVVLVVMPSKNVAA
jgi:drug/metabolite transporter (DMT)-like permease